MSGSAQSGVVLLAAYIGGVGYFVGPVIGAIIVTYLQVMLSDVTAIWQLYFGLLFIVIVMFAPNGIAGLLAMHQPLWRAGVLHRLAPAYLVGLVPLAVMTLGAILAIEMAHRFAARASDGPDMSVPAHSARRDAAAALARRRRDDGRRAPPVPPHLALRRERLERGDARRARPGGAPVSAPAIALAAVEKRFGRTEIIRGVSLEIPAGERHAVIGPNGAGKSTLFNLISGRFAPSAGEIRLKGEDVTGLRPFEINRRGLSRSFQVTNIFPRLSVWENVRCAVLWSLGYRYSFWHGIDALAEVRARTESILEQINLLPRRQVQAGVLAYAEQRALEIGITIASGAEIILLDEPTAGMSHSEADQAVALIRAVTRGKTLVIVEHDMAVVFGLADRISVLVYGEIIATDVPEKIKASKAVQEAYLGTVPA